MKKIISVLLLSVILLSSFGIPVSAEQNDQNLRGYSVENGVVFIPGDANGNGNLDILDATAIQRKIADFIVQSFHPVSSDVDNDGKVTVLDATMIQMLLVDYLDLDITEFSQENETVSSYLNEVTYDPSDHFVSKLDDYVLKADGTKPTSVGIDIAIPANGTLTLYEKYNIRVIPVSAGIQTVYHLIPYTVTKYVIASEEGDFLQAGYLMPVGSLRMIHTTYMINIRDLGGWSCDGGTVRYGRLFRGCAVYNRQVDIDLLHDVLGIRSELDLRWDSEINAGIEAYGMTGYYSLIGSDVDLLHVDGTWYNNPRTGVIAKKQRMKKMLQFIFDAVKNNKPLYFHCVTGADRAGTLAFVIEMLLGVSLSDTEKDYEMSSFYTGVDTDTHARRRNESDWLGLISAFDDYDGSTLQNRVIHWALSSGLTLDQINEFRQSMIDGSPVILTPENIR